MQLTETSTANSETVSNDGKSMLEACFFGVNQDYGDTLKKMHALHKQVVDKRLPSQVMLLEHAPVITVTRQHLYKSLKTSPAIIRQSGISLVTADRGGDVTFHGPGQLVGYPLIDIRTDKCERFVDVSAYVRGLESSLLRALSALGLSTPRLLPGFTGIWIKTRDHNDKIVMKKLAAIGVGIKDGVTKHGFALNINIDAQRYTEHIIPCGLKDRGVITLSEAFYLERLEMPQISDIVAELAKTLAKTFSLSLKWRENRKYSFEENKFNG